MEGRLRELFSPKMQVEEKKIIAPTLSVDMDSLKRRRKIIRLVAFLDHQNQQLQKELRVEKLRRTEDLSRLLRSTFYLEAKLRSERNHINQKLIDKDNEILRLLRINRFLLKKCKCTEIEEFRKKLKCNNGDEINVVVDKEVLQCTKCKLDFYGVEREDISIQTSGDKRVLDDDTTQCCSSSDDTVSSFLGARRSLRYTSKRKFTSPLTSPSQRNSSNSEENNSSLTSYASQTDKEDIAVYENTSSTPVSRTFDKMHGITSFSADMKPNNQFEASNDNWYASGSENEEDTTTKPPSNKPYAANTRNPVLECVNQILLQESMEDYVNTSTEKPSVPITPVAPKALKSANTSSSSPNITRKRVQFSNQNSLVHIPRVTRDSPILMASELSALDLLNYESIYSNEYERIMDDSSSTVSNLYVDMESKIRNSVLKQPPALPPKPANLIKIQKKENLPTLPLDVSSVASSEPDYCSISEVQIKVDVHKAPKVQPPPLQTKVEENDDFDFDKIKLPNVAAIIVPKTTPQTTPIKPTPTKSNLKPLKVVPNILAEINKRTPIIVPKPTLLPLTPKKQNVITHSSPIIETPITETSLPLEEEFDWYNLDAEFVGGVKQQPDVISIKSHREIDENSNDQQMIEYNLDEEFTDQPDIIKENLNNNGNLLIIEETENQKPSIKSKPTILLHQPVVQRRKIYFPEEIL